MSERNRLPIGSKNIGAVLRKSLKGEARANARPVVKARRR